MPPPDNQQHQVESTPVNTPAPVSNVMAKPRTERAKKPLLLILLILVIAVVVLIGWALGWKIPQIITLPKASS